MYYRVLIVEDDPMVSMINEQYVNRNKAFRVVEKCKDGKSALEYLENNDVDLIILDVYMPLMDGFETLRQIRKNKKSVDIIMVTAANDRASLEEALHLGVVDYLVKPFTYDRFRIALDKYVSHLSALKDLDTLNQKNIDFIIENAHKKSEDGACQREIFAEGRKGFPSGGRLGFKSRHVWRIGRIPDSCGSQVRCAAVHKRRHFLP